jgi:nanoRNase/pAp phosphatase (c-di-AMP/oligoRNAs hydrolase)
MAETKHRLITRSDFDGVTCAALFRELDMIDEIKFVHPKDMQDGSVLVTDNDITANLPFVRGVRMAFDHHASETVRLDSLPDNLVIDPKAPSAARVVYDHYGGKTAFPNIADDLIEAVDKGDSGRFGKNEILAPTDWVLLNFIMDARTGLDAFKHFDISNHQMMVDLVDYCRSMSIGEILNQGDVKQRADLYFEQTGKASEQIKKCTEVRGNLGVLDLRAEDTIFAANRFLVYALFPGINISMHVLWGPNKLKAVFAIGKSVLNRTSKTNIGELMLHYGGGGHENAGTCRIEPSEAEAVKEELIARITEDG